jgi:glycosyltransferase involved in cell wall biosynthesis
VSSDDVSDGRVLVVIPAWNEEQALPAVLRELRDHPGLDVLVVDDGSADRTSAVALAEGALVATLPYNLGIGGALRTGFRYAARQGYRTAIQFDADGQHRADQIPALLAGLAGGADIVIGTRFASDQSTYAVGRVRGGAMRLLRLLILLLSGSRMTDTSSGFRAFNRKAIELFAGSYPAEYMDSVEALLLALQSGLVAREVPVQMRERLGGTASQHSWRLVYHYVRVVVVLASSVRLSKSARADRRLRRTSTVEEANRA